MDRKILMIFLICIIAFSISSVNAINSDEIITNSSDVVDIDEGLSSISTDDNSESNNIWVSPEGSDDNDGSEHNPVATIAKAVELADNGYTINIADGNYVNNATLSISKNLTLKGGANTVIDGNSLRTMEITVGATVALNNLSFINGKSNFAGAILNEGTLSIDNSKFYLNEGNGSNSGTIITNKNKLNITNSKFTQNSASRGVVNNQNGAILFINASEFYENNMTLFSNAYGIIYTTSSITNIYNTIFRNNSAKSGGVIYATKMSSAIVGTVNIVNTTFESNIADAGQGGALFVSGGNCIVKESTFINNTATFGKFSGGEGGAIYVSINGYVNVTDSIFKNNRAKLGAVLYSRSNANSSILYSVLLDNIADGDYLISSLDTASGIVTVDYNWWGNNTPKNLVQQDIILNSWVIMTVTPTVIRNAELGDIKTISVNFNKYLSEGNIGELSKSLPVIDVNFGDIGPTLINNVVSTIGGVASINYTVTGNNQIIVKSGSECITVPVTIKESSNVVTNGTFFDFFDVNGKLLDTISFNNLIFEGEFSNLGVNVITIPRTMTITGNNSLLKDMAFNINGDNVILNNLKLDVTKYIESTDGAIIKVMASDILVNNVTINYDAVDGYNNAFSVYATGANNFKLVNSTITFTGHNVEGKVFAQAIKIEKSNNAIVENNIIDAFLPAIDCDFSNWGSINTDLVFAIGVQSSNNVKIYNNKVNTEVNARGTNANSPTFDAIIAHSAENLVIYNNTVTHRDLITPAGNTNYLYAIDLYESNNVTVESNKVLLDTYGGKEGAGTAYAIQATGPYTGLKIIKNNLTTKSNGPNLGIYSQNYYGKTDITAIGNWVNVTGFAGIGGYALVSGMEFQDNVAKAYDNVIYVHNTNSFNKDNNIAGITYVQSTAGDHVFDIQNNTIYSEGQYAILISTAENSQIIGNTLYANTLKGNDAALIKSGSNNVIKDNKPALSISNILIDVDNVWVGNDAIIGVTLNSTATGSVNITVAGKTYTIKLTDGRATLKVSDLLLGVNSVVVEYSGDEKFVSATNSTTFKVLKGIVTNETFFDYFINGTLADYVPEGATLDFRGKFYSNESIKFDLIINKPINMISTTGDAFIDLNTTAGSLLGENPGACFTINNGGSGSNVTGIVFHNTQVWIYDAHNVILDNISVIVENHRVGSGVGTTSIRHGSTNVTIKNSYIYTSNNGGSSSIVLTHVQNCTVENNTIVGEGNVGNLLYLNTFNDNGCDLSNDYNKIINNKITGPSPAQGICYGIGINGNNNLIAGNVINYAGAGIVPAFGASPNNNTYRDNILMGGASMNVDSKSIAYNNSVSGSLTIGSGSIAYNNSAKSISVSSNSIVYNSVALNGLSIQAGAKITNISASSLTVNGKNSVIENVTIFGMGTIKTAASNTTLINSKLSGMLTVQSNDNKIKYNNIVLNNGAYAILATGMTNVVTNNYLIAGDNVGDGAVNSTQESNIVKDNLPVVVVPIVINTTNVFEGSDVIIDVIINSTGNLTGNFTVKINNKEYSLSIIDSKGRVFIFGLYAGDYDIEVLCSNEAYSLINATSKVSVYGNVVTNETFFIYFDKDGMLRSEIPFNELIFKGEFSNIVGIISIDKPVKIIGDGAVLKDIAFAILTDNIILDNMTLISNVADENNGGSLILVAGNNVNITNMNISYVIKQSVDAIVINTNGVSNLNIVNNTIFFEANPISDSLTASAINLESVSNSFINNNNITSILPYLYASNYDMSYFMMGINTVNPIRMRECTNVTFSKNDVNTTSNNVSANFPTLQCMFIVGSKDCVIDGNNFSMIDLITPKGTSNYLYGINIGYNKNLLISNNNFKMSTAGGKDAAGTAYAIQGVECEVSIIRNNITSLSNGPNLGIYVASMTGGTSELYIADNFINVTGLATSSGSWALVSGIEIQNGNAKIYNNTIYTYNVGNYDYAAYMYGISYAQYMYGDRSFDVRNNFVHVDGHYAVSFINVDGSNVTDNILITRDLGGDVAVEIKAGKGNVVENNYPRSSNLIFDVTGDLVKVLINVAIDGKATGNITIIVDGDKYTVAIVNGSAKLELNNLSVGSHYVEAKYDGNSIVTESYNSTKFTLNSINSEINIEVNGITVGETAVITATVTSGATGDVTFIINGKTYNVSLVDGKAVLNVSDLSAGTCYVFAQYNGDKYYATSVSSTTFNITKIVSNIIVKVNDIVGGNYATINVITTQKDIDGLVVVTVDSKEYLVNLVKGKGALYVSGLDEGNYEVTAKFLGNNKYFASENSTEFKVYKLATNLSINVKSVNYATGLSVHINIILPEDINGVVVVTVEGKDFHVTIKNGKGILYFTPNLSPDSQFSTFKVSANFEGNEKYLPNSTSELFSVYKFQTSVNIEVNNITVGENAVISVNVPRNGSYLAVDSNVVINIDGKEYVVSLFQGKGTLTVSGLKEGIYNITALYNGNKAYLSASSNATFKVSKIDSCTIINVSDILVGENAIINIIVPKISSGVVSLTIGNAVYNVAIIDGKGLLAVPDLIAGDYKVIAKFIGDDKYLASENTTNFTVSKVSDYNITVDIVDIIKGENATIIVTTPRDSNGEVIVTINGKDYNGTVVNGVAKVIIPDLDEGTYNVVTFYTGDNKYDAMVVNGTITVNKNTKTTLTMDDVVKYFNGTQRLVATLVDGQGNPIANQTIVFTIKGVDYTRRTNASGSASIAINLVAGIYSAFAVFDGTDKYDGAMTKVKVSVKSTIEGKDTTLYYCNGTGYEAKFTDSTGKALANTNVTFNINGVFYTRTADANGVARLSINLLPGTYIITAYNPVTGEQTSNTVKVLPVLTATDLSMKYGDGSTFNANLVDGQGKPIDGVNITFNINGVFYNRTTDANGVARLNINLMSGEYIITSTYGTAWASNKITISA